MLGNLDLLPVVDSLPGRPDSRPVVVDERLTVGEVAPEPAFKEGQLLFRLQVKQHETMRVPLIHRSEDIQEETPLVLLADFLNVGITNTGDDIGTAVPEVQSGQVVTRPEVETARALGWLSTLAGHKHR